MWKIFSNFVCFSENPNFTSLSGEHNLPPTQLDCNKFYISSKNWWGPVLISPYLPARLTGAQLCQELLNSKQQQTVVEWYIQCWNLNARRENKKLLCTLTAMAESEICTLMSFRLWNFKEVGPKIKIFIKRKSLYIFDTTNDSSSKRAKISKLHQEWSKFFWNLFLIKTLV